MANLPLPFLHHLAYVASGDQIKEDELGGACSTHGRDQKSSSANCSTATLGKP